MKIKWVVSVFFNYISYICIGELAFYAIKIITMAKRILFVNQEITPYVPDSEMATMGKELSQIVQESGYEIRTFMPKWGSINERRGQLHEVIRLSGMNLVIDETDHPLIIKVASIPSTRIQVYFIDNDDYFPKYKSGEIGIEYTQANNGERAIFFARGVLETIKKLRWVPDLIVCQGWMSSLIPLYMKKAYNDEPMFAETKIAALIHGKLPKNALTENLKHCIEFKKIKAKDLGEHKSAMDYKDLIKLSIDYSDYIILGSDKLNQPVMKLLEKVDKPILQYQSENTVNNIASYINNIVE